MSTQKEKILNELLKGRMLSKREIMLELGIINGAGRISELRQDGYKIKPIMCKSENGKTFAKYALYADGVRREF